MHVIELSEHMDNDECDAMAATVDEFVQFWNACGDEIGEMVASKEVDTPEI